MKNILLFEEMLTPRIITMVYWLGLVMALVVGIQVMSSGYGFSFGQFVAGLAAMVGVALAFRIWCELLIIFFKMNEALQDIRKNS